MKTGEGSVETTGRLHSDIQARTSPWPFLYSVMPGKGIVLNVEPKKVPPSMPNDAKKTPLVPSTVVKGHRLKSEPKVQPFRKAEKTASVLDEVDAAWREPASK